MTIGFLTINFLNVQNIQLLGRVTVMVERVNWLTIVTHMVDDLDTVAIGRATMSRSIEPMYLLMQMLNAYNSVNREISIIY